MLGESILEILGRLSCFLVFSQSLPLWLRLGFAFSALAPCSSSLDEEDCPSGPVFWLPGDRAAWGEVRLDGVCEAVCVLELGGSWLVVVVLMVAEDE